MLVLAEWASQPPQRQRPRSSSNNNNEEHKEEEHRHTRCESPERLSDDRLGLPRRPGHLADVFVGGSCGEGSRRWRERVVCALRRRGLSCYDPAASEPGAGAATLCENGVLHWKKPIDRCRVLLFVVSGDTRSLTTMILAAYYIGVNKNTVLCVQYLPADGPDCEKTGVSLCKLFRLLCSNRRNSPRLTPLSMGKERRRRELPCGLLGSFACFSQRLLVPLRVRSHLSLTVVPLQMSKQAVKDYNRGRVYLSDLAKRKHVPVFDSVEEAVRCVEERCREGEQPR